METYGEEEDYLSWLPSPTSRRHVQLPLNLRTSVSSITSTSSSARGCPNYSRSSRLSSIFSTDSNKDDDDDPFELRKLNNNSKVSGTSSACNKAGGPVGLLVQIDSESPTSSNDRSDLGSKFQSAMEDHIKADDSLLSLKISGCDLSVSCLEKTTANPVSELNTAFTDWDRLKDEASAIAGDLKKTEERKVLEPRTPNLLNEPKKLFDLSSYSPCVLNSPLVPLDDSADLKFQLVDISPNVPPTKLLQFDNGRAKLGPAKKKLPFSLMQPTIFSSKTSDLNSKPKTSSGKTLEESKENSAPTNLINFEMQDEVFIDDQLEKAIKASSSASQNGLMDSSFGLSSFATPSRSSNRRMTSTTSSNANSSLREKSMISSTPLVSTKKSIYAPLRTGLATPIKPILQGGNHFATPQTGSSRPYPLKPFSRRGSSLVEKPIKSRYSQLPPPSPMRSVSSGKSSISGASFRSSTSGQTTTSGLMTPSKFISPGRTSASSSKKISPSHHSYGQPSPMKSGSQIQSYVRTEKSKSRYSMIPASPLRPDSTVTASRPPSPSSSLVKMTPSRRSIATPSSSISKVTRSLYGSAATQTRTPLIAKPSISDRNAASSTLPAPMRTPLIAKPPTGDRNTASKLQTLRQGPILRSKLSMSSQLSHQPPSQPRTDAAETPSLLLKTGSAGAKRPPMIPRPKMNSSMNSSMSKIPSKLK